MAKDKKKRNDDGINQESQLEALSAVDALVFGGDDSLLQIDIQKDDGITDMTEHEFAQSIFDMMQQKKKDRTKESSQSEVSDDASKNKIDVSDIVGTGDTPEPEMEGYFKELDDRLESESKESDEDDEYEVPENDGEEEEETSPLCEITIEKNFTDVFKIVNISDGIRTLSIDLNTIPADTFELPESELLNPISIALMRFDEVLTHFYPGLMMSKERLDSHMRHVSECDATKFKLFEYPDGNNNFIVGYYVSDETCDEFMALVQEIHKFGYLASFLNILKEFAESDGFSFRSMSSDYMHQVMMTELMDLSSQEFIITMMNDSDTEISADHFNQQAGEIIPIRPYDYEEMLIKNILDPDSESDDEEGEEGFGINIPDDEEEEDEPQQNNEVPAETAEEPAEHVADEVDGSGLFDGVAEEEEEDPEELERQYYASKGKKPPQEKSVPKKKADDDDDSKWIIPRR